MIRYPRKEMTVTNKMARMDQPAKGHVRSGDPYVVAHIAACSSLHLLSASVWRPSAILVVQLRETKLSIVTELVV